MAKRNAGLRLGDPEQGFEFIPPPPRNHSYLVECCNTARARVFAAAVALVDARPVGSRWTRESCRAHYDAQVELDAAVVAYRAARALCRCRCARGAPP